MNKQFIIKWLTQEYKSLNQIEFWKGFISLLNVNFKHSLCLLTFYHVISMQFHELRTFLRNNLNALHYNNGLYSFREYIFCELANKSTMKCFDFSLSRVFWDDIINNECNLAIFHHTILELVCTFSERNVISIIEYNNIWIKKKCRILIYLNILNQIRLVNMKNWNPIFLVLIRRFGFFKSFEEK